ncbi:MAG TPA: dienelactone hydrolase family protein [Bacteriovoracaceae bacterium]|nr:dienelactone hydrolase family protein [Bacteriovoracaceae bacterium]
MEVMGNYLTAETPDGLLDIYTASASTQEKLPVVLVLQEAFGVNAHIKNICHRFAGAGYLAMAPELFHRSGRHLQVEYGDRKNFMPLMGNLCNEEIIQDLKHTLHLLAQLPGADPRRVSTVGFCMGGFASVLAAQNFNLQGMVSFYGAGLVQARDGIGLKPIAHELGKVKCRSLFFFGGKDASIPPHEVRALKEKLKTEKVPFDEITFENSDHGFFCDERKTYDQDAAAEAWKITLEFLKQVNFIP